MRWQVKAFIQAALSRVPYHNHVYRWLQQVSGSNPLDINDQYGRKCRLLKRMRDQGLEVAGKEFLEVGTGWYPILPMLLYLLGAKRIVTLDLNPWLTPTSLRDTVKAYESILDRVSADFEVPLVDLKERMSAATSQMGGTNSDVREDLKGFRIEYQMPCDAGATGLPDHSLDYIVSSNVMEHVPGPIIEQILVESRRILKHGGYNIHHINPGDHFAFDTRITTAHFLRYSPRAWYFIGGSGVAYHNRLRCVDFVRMFERAGLEITHSYTSCDPRALAELESGRARVHPTFQGYSNEELACDIVGIFARNP